MAILTTKTTDDTNSSADINTLSERAVDKNDVDAKGDIIGGTGDNAYSNLSVGSNDEVLTADSNEATGMKWAAATGGHTIEDEGTPLAQQTNMNFTGTGVTVTDAGGKTVVTIPSTGLADIVDDTSPQLGGDLASNGFDIDMSDGKEVSTDQIIARDGDGLKLYNDGSTGLFINDDGTLSTNDETAGDTSPGGITVKTNTGTFARSMSYKDPSQAHGLTSWMETDTYCQFQLANSNGAFHFRTATDGTDEVTAQAYFYALRGTAQTTTSTGGRSAVEYWGYQHNGSNSLSAIANDGNMIGFRNNTSTKVIFKGDGDIYTDTDQTGGLAGVFDNEDDIKLAAALKYEVKGYKEHNLKKYSDRLRELGIMENTMISHRKVTDLLLGCIGQLYEKINILEQKLLEA